MSNTLKLGNGQWATGKDTILAYNDLNSNYKPLAFSFSRDSSATVINKDGLIETVGSGEPRIDFKDNTKGALLLEPTRSNIVTDSATGIFKLPTPSLINTLAPDNSNLAVIPIVYSVANRYEYIISGGTYSTNTKLTYSWYRKRISTPMVNTYLGDLRPSGVNLSYVGDTKQIESNINGYDRFEAVLNITDGSATTTVRMYFGDVIGVGNSSIAYWGHQLEQGSYATSYIPTSGSAVTRVEEVCNNGGNDQVINSTEGVLYVEIEGFEDDNENRYISLCDGSNSNSIRIFYYREGATVFFRKSVNNVGVITASVGSINKSELTKISIRYNSTSFDIFSNGVKVSTNLNSDTFSNNTLNTINFTDDNGITAPFLGNIKDVRVYNTSLTDQELIALTTI